jgi:short subunit dehydrogenase-like uncharacterized protein
MSDRQFDVAILGATGYSGTITAEYMAGKRKNERIAIAGRSLDKLDELKADLVKINPANSDITVVVVDATNFDQVKALAAKSKVMISFVGPYRKFGEPVVRACVEAGCNYLDTTGEPPFVQEIIEKYHDEAQKKKLMLLPGCGYHSVIADIAVQITKDEFYKEDGSKVVTAKGYVRYNGKYGSTFSNGTWGTFLNSMGAKAPRKPREATKSAAPRRRTVKAGSHWQSGISCWAVPFVEGADLHIVRRSNELTLDKTGSEDFGYAQFASFSFIPPLSLLIQMVVMMFILIFARIALVRNILLKRSFPNGGPTKEQRVDASSDFWVIADSDKKKRKRLHMRTAGAYDATGYCAAEVAFTLINDRTSIAQTFGVVTPAAVMDTQLQRNLRDRAGVTWKFE